MIDTTGTATEQRDTKPEPLWMVCRKAATSWFDGKT